MKKKHFSQSISTFHERTAPEVGNLVGYGAIIDSLDLTVPIPRQLALISEKRRQYVTEEWLVFTPRHQPHENLYDHLVFALKYEGINLLFFKKLFEKLEPKIIEQWITNEPQSRYSRKIWFLYEWLMQKPLEVPDLKEGNYISLVNEELQFASPVSSNSNRHRIKNNLPGTVDFCPLVHKTPKLENYIRENLSEKTNSVIKGVHKDILHRASAFLLLKDSKASFTIEGENPTQNRTIRWGRAIGQAGSTPLNKEELLRLQQIVIENSRFIKMGYRTEGGFIGEHDRNTGEPIPEHISARWQDVESLMSGLLSSTRQMEDSGFHPVLTASKIAFGFVFIHPFVDGNGRLHRYLIHHLLAKMKFTPQGIIFPVSAAILERIDDYRKVLENYSYPLLDFIDWKKTSGNNIEVLNQTIDYYRFFDATAQAEFLYDCVNHTINTIIPQEVSYLQRYDSMKTWLDDRFQMPDKTVALLIRFLEQNDGALSKRAREREFAELTDEEVKEIEENYKEVMSES
ncbi:Fic family protein [Solitalea lacus]|uniref:Fic family protein n=1 Tax=Solitalea lacus TaxID=2911172 RepID=UPI001EDB2F2B|nr:Fic family protein [Solitalea lacus]UKJ05803.1 Fic family protein [Solitalea lacus]